MSAYAGSRDFGYMEMTIKPISFWDRLLDIFEKLFNQLIRDPIRSDLFWGIISLIILGLGVFYILRMKFKSALVSSSQNMNSMLVESEGQQVDFDQLMGNALERKDYRMAIRYLYLKALNTLSDEGVIHFKEWKTSYEYQSELPDSARENYSKLALLFEYSWYGDFGVQRTDFDKGTNYAQILEESIQ